MVMERGLPLAREIEDAQVLGPALVAAALLDWTRGDDQSALAYLENWYEVTRSRAYVRSQNLTDAVRVACGAGNIELADQLLDNVITAAERDRLSTLMARATIAEARGEASKALYAEAAEGWKAFGCKLEHALALRGAGNEAEAAAILDELGVVPPATQTAARTAK
jgi:hypothetical protein